MTRWRPALTRVALQVCLAAVGLVCDLCRGLMSNILPYCDEIMQLLLENLGVRSARARARPALPCY